MPLSPDEHDKLKNEYIELISFYQKVKEVVITSERFNKEQKLSIPAIVELRSAFDHVARAHAVLYELPISEDYDRSEYEYCHKNLDKAHGHLYRAAYDAYDVIAIALAEEIDSTLDSFSKNTLFIVIPDASIKIIRPFDEAKRLVTAEKCKKDVICKSEEEEIFTHYEKAANQLADVRDELLSHMSSMVAHDKEERDLRAKEKSHHWSGITIGISGILVGICLTFFSMKNSSSNSSSTEKKSPETSKFTNSSTLRSTPQPSGIK